MKIFTLENGKYICSQSLEINLTGNDDSKLLFIKDFSEILNSSNVNQYIKFWDIEKINDIKLILDYKWNTVQCLAKFDDSFE